MCLAGFLKTPQPKADKTYGTSETRKKRSISNAGTQEKKKEFRKNVACTQVGLELNEQKTNQ